MGIGREGERGGEIHFHIVTFEAHERGASFFLAAGFLIWDNLFIVLKYTTFVRYRITTCLESLAYFEQFQAHL